MTKSNNKGFTLVELAIVLVIIGLIVSSVLVGQDLIKAAELRALVRQVDQYQAAVNTFIGKYGGLPGDINGSQYFAEVGAAAIETVCDNDDAGDGDGDGIIEDQDDNTADGTDIDHDGEIACFWKHLTIPNKELLPGGFGGEGATANTVGEHMPALKTSNDQGWGVFYDGSADHWFVTGVLGAASNQYNIAESFVPIDAFNIDDKIDDGAPLTGSVQALSENASGNPNDQDVGDTTWIDAGASSTQTDLSTAAEETLCVLSAATPSEYQFAPTQQNCALKFKMSTF